MFSGGIGSYITAKRVIERHGTSHTVLLFADVRGDNPIDSHLGEDEDTYRFIDDAVAHLNATLVTLIEGRSIWDVFRDKRFLGNSRLANCSHLLRQVPCREWLDANCTTETTVYVGIDWAESHRLGPIQRNYEPYRAAAPLCDPPYIDKKGMLAECEADGIAIPRLYAQGFSHNNCGAFCVRAGQAHFKRLLDWNRDRYLFHERKEQELREYLDKDVSIMTEIVNGERRQLTMRNFRLRMERQACEQRSLFDEYDEGGCGCFVDAVPGVDLSE